MISLGNLAFTGRKNFQVYELMVMVGVLLALASIFFLPSVFGVVAAYIGVGLALSGGAIGYFKFIWVALRSLTR